MLLRGVTPLFKIFESSSIRVTPIKNRNDKAYIFVLFNIPKMDSKNYLEYLKNCWFCAEIYDLFDQLNSWQNHWGFVFSTVS